MKSGAGSKKVMLPICLVLLAACKPAADAKDQTTVQAETRTVATEMAPAVSETSTAINDPAIIYYEGFGPATFGANEETVRMAWGKPLETTKPQKGASCYYLFPEMNPDLKRGIGFMFEEGKFVRYDVQDASQIAPGNFKVGDAATDIKTAFAGRIEETPHKYIAKEFILTVTPEDQSPSRLIFEIGEDGKVMSWRIGMPPQIFYVEGCG
ncbi:MAG: lectin [Arenimonas sp.]